MRAAALGLVLSTACQTPAPPSPPAPPGWRLVHHERFDGPFAEPVWIEDRYGDDSPYHVDAYGRR